MFSYFNPRGFLIGFLFLLTITSCKKDEENTPVRTTEMNLATTWRLSKYLRNNVDETSQLLISSYEETYINTNSLDYTRSYLDENSRLQSEAGKWKLKEDKIRLEISGVNSVKLTRVTGTVSSSYHDIQKITEQELWYSYTNGGDRHEFRFVKK